VGESRVIRKFSLGIALFLVICGIFYYRSHRTKVARETAYAANRQVIVWSTTAQVREPSATLNFGDPVQIIDEFEDQVQVRTAAGVTGWVSKDDLLSSDFWKKMQDLDAASSKLPVEARGHTHVLSNLRLDPGRESPRIRQLNKDVPVDLIERQVAAVPIPPGSAVQPPATAPADASASPDDQAQPAADSSPGTSADVKKEDWWLVRAHLADKTSLSGWVLGRFIDLDVPPPLPDYASSAGLRIVAWFELNRVPVPGGEPKPQYLLVGTHGPEGQPCDFMSLRVYTWGVKRGQYETAFVESDVCGKLPVKVTPMGTAGDQLTFAFEDLSEGVRQERVYRMQRTIVRRVRQNNSAPDARKRRH
jgi:hypothetical protein